MDKALVFRTKDCRFESCQGHIERKTPVHENCLGKGAEPVVLYSHHELVVKAADVTNVPNLFLYSPSMSDAVQRKAVD